MVQAYYDNTGLYRKYGTSKTTANVAGEYVTVGERREVEVTLDLTTVGSTAGGTIVSDVTWIPAGARIEEVQVVCETAADSTSDDGALNLGLIASDRSTEIDFNGLIAALPQANMDAAGEINDIRIGHTYVGALVGTTIATTGYICADYDTHAFTAGKVRIRIRYYKP